MKKINLHLSEPLLVRTFSLESTYETTDLLKKWFDIEYKLNENEEQTLKQASKIVRKCKFLE